MSEMLTKLQSIEKIPMFDRFQMSKPAIKRWFGVAVALTVAGAIVGTVTVIAAVADGAISFGGPQFVSFDVERVAWAIVALVLASFLGGLGTLAAIVAWAGALANTSHLPEKAWFATVLALGLVSMGWVALIAYVIAGPDSSTAPAAAASDATQAR